MRRSIVIIGAILLMAAMALPAIGAGPSWPTPGPAAHAHMLLLASGECIDLGANQVLPRNAQHAHLHVGTAGDAVELAGHGIIPTSPITPFANCAALLAAP